MTREFDRYDEIDLDALKAEARRQGYSSWREFASRNWPAEWPDQNIVHLDNVGDPGIWLQDLLEESLLIDPADDEWFAKYLAESYLSTYKQYWGDPYFDVMDCYEDFSEFFDDVVDDFDGFIVAWRKMLFDEIGSPYSRKGIANIIRGYFRLASQKLRKIVRGVRRLKSRLPTSTAP